MKTAFFLSLATCASVNGVQLKGYLSKDDIPSSGKDWYTLDNGVEFQPSDNVDPRVEHVRKLWGSSNAQDDPIFVDGSETKYDENAQAWRLLGFYVDCNHCDDANNEAECLAAGEKTYCQRYLLWAAYVDLNYSGNGAGEYKIYDRVNKKWNDDTCQQSGSDRCVKMNCHEANTHWSLLGVFKEPDYSTFFQQLFAYQGDCTWTEDEYNGMSSAMNIMPAGCTKANNGLYYDIKPVAGGSATIGLYNDKYCMEEHTGSDVTVRETLSSTAADDDATQQSLVYLENGAATWNEAFDAFKYCHPCKVSDYVSIVNDGEDSWNSNCKANAGLNQCEQFAGTTNMIPATYNDVMAAESQGTLSYLNMAGVRVGVTEKEQEKKWQRNLVSAWLLIASFFLWLWSLMRCCYKTDNAEGLRQPLMINRNKNSSLTRRRSVTRRNSGSSYASSN